MALYSLWHRIAVLDVIKHTYPHLAGPHPRTTDDTRASACSAPVLDGPHGDPAAPMDAAAPGRASTEEAQQRLRSRRNAAGDSDDDGDDDANLVFELPEEAAPSDDEEGGSGQPDEDRSGSEALPSCPICAWCWGRWVGQMGGWVDATTGSMEGREAWVKGVGRGVSESLPPPMIAATTRTLAASPRWPQLNPMATHTPSPGPGRHPTFPSRVQASATSWTRSRRRSRPACTPSAGPASRSGCIHRRGRAPSAR